MRKRSIVVDANIARSAGTASQAPRSTHARQALLAIFRRGHYLIMSTEIMMEWEKHESRFSLKWRANMQRRGRIRTISVLEFKRIRSLIKNLPEGSVNKDALLKDSLIFTAALAADEIIISDDCKLKLHLSGLYHFCEEVGELQWGSPEEEGELCADWIDAGAPMQPERFVKYLATIG